MLHFRKSLVYGVHVVTVHYGLALLMGQVVKLLHQYLVAFVEGRQSVVERSALTLLTLFVEFYYHLTVLKYYGKYRVVVNAKRNDLYGVE